MDNLHNYLFHYNSYTGMWAAFRREDYNNYMERMYHHEGSLATFNADFNVLHDMVVNGLIVHPEKKTVYEEYGLKEPK